MLDAVLPHITAFFLLGAMLSLPHRHRPAAGVAAAFLLLLLETALDAEGRPVPGPSTGLAVLILLGVALAVISGDWRDFSR